MNKISVFSFQSSALSQRGQTLMELVVGIALVAVVVGAIAILGVSSLRNSQFSRNQAQATQLAQQNIEKVRTIKNTDFGVCLSGQSTNACSSWEQIWNVNFGKQSTGCTTACTFQIRNAGCTTADGFKPVCLQYSASPVATGANFTYQIVIEDEVVGLEKKVISTVYWQDVSGAHSSQLVTILGKR